MLALQWKLNRRYKWSDQLELPDCLDNAIFSENNITCNSKLEYNAEKLKEILNRIMQGIVSIITSALICNKFL